MIKFEILKLSDLLLRIININFLNKTGLIINILDII